MEPTECAARTVLAMRLFALGLVGLALVPALAPAATAPEPSSAVKVEVQSNYGKLPLSFEANQGQTDSQVKFLARGRGYALFLTPTEAVLSLAKPQAQGRAETSATSSPEASWTVLAMQLSGANPEPQVTGRDALPGRVNYLRGKDPAHWHTQIPTYAKVAYEGIYPGVDLVYYGNQGQLEYDFVVAPGADPGVLKLVFRGADRIEINAAGDLVLSTASGDIRMPAPVIYQETAGVRTTVAGGYVLKETQEASFEAAAYDTSRRLVIDPVLVYSTYLGGSDFELGLGIAADDRGKAYVTGVTNSTNFPTVNAVQPDFGGSSDVFVAKLDRNGRQLLYSTYLGGSDGDDGLGFAGIAVDDRGNAYVTGDTTSTDFPTVNAVQPTFGGGFFDAFVAKLTPNGSQLLYSTYLGGSDGDSGNGIAVDDRGNAYVTGRTFSTDFPTVNAVQPHRRGDDDAFVAKLDRNGRQLLYSTYLGGSGDEQGQGIAVDDRGNAYVTGGTNAFDFPTVNAVQPTGLGGDAFVAKLDRNGRQLLYSTYLGGSDGDVGFGIAVDDHGNAYVTGVTGSPDFPTVNAVQRHLRGVVDAFVAKLDRNGRQLLYSTYLGGSNENLDFGGIGDVGRGIAVDDRGNAYVTGDTTSTDFPTVNAVQRHLRGVVDAFVAKFDPNDRQLLYSTYLGGSDFEEGLGIAADDRGNAYVTGVTGSPDFPTVNAVQRHLRGDGDAFVTKLGPPRCGAASSPVTGEKGLCR